MYLHTWGHQAGIARNAICHWQESEQCRARHDEMNSSPYFNLRYGLSVRARHTEYMNTRICRAHSIFISFAFDRTRGPMEKMRGCVGVVCVDMGSRWGGGHDPWTGEPPLRDPSVPCCPLLTRPDNRTVHGGHCATHTRAHNRAAFSRATVCGQRGHVYQVPFVAAVCRTAD